MAPCVLLLSVLLFSGLSPHPDLNSDQGHFSCRLRRRRPQHGRATHVIWDHFSMGACTYGVLQKISTTFSLHQVRREYVRRLSPLQIVCSVRGSRSVITAVVTNPRITLHLGNGFWSVIFDTTDKPVKVNCQKPQFTSLKRCYKLCYSDHRKANILSARNTELQFETQFGIHLEQDNRKEEKKATAFTTLLVRKRSGEPHKTTKMKKNNIFAAALKTDFIKLKSGTKMQHIHRNTKENVQVHADGLRSRQSNVQNVKTMFLKSLARNVKKGSAFPNSIAEASTQVGRQSVMMGFNMKNKTNPSQNIKEAAANPERKQTAVIMEAFNNKWAQLQTRNSIELETDPELRSVTKKQTVKPHSAFQTAGLRMREEPPHDRTVGGEERKVTDSFTEQGVDKTVVDKPLCQGLIHQTEAGLKHCKDRLEKSSMRAQRFPNDDNTEDSHFYYFDGILKRVGNSLQNKKQSM